MATGSTYRASCALLLYGLMVMVIGDARFASEEPQPNKLQRKNALNRICKEVARFSNDDYFGGSASAVLTRSGPSQPRIVAMLTNRLQHHDPQIRQGAALLLGAIGQSARIAVPVLKQKLKDDDPLVRIAAALALWEIRSTVIDSWPVLLSALQHDNAAVRQSASHSLIYMRKEAQLATSALIRLVKTHKDARVRVSAITTLSKFSTDSLAILPVFRLALQDDSPLVQINAASALWEIRDFPATLLLDHDDRDLLNDYRQVLRILSTVAKDKDANVRIAACEIWGNLGGVASFDRNLLVALEENTFDHNSKVRRSAVRALGEVRCAATIPALIKALHDRNRLVRMEAIRSVGLFRDEASKAVPVLVALLKVQMEASDYAMIRIIVQCLARIGPGAITGTTALRKLLKSESGVLRVEAAIALWQIESDPSAILSVSVPALQDKTPGVRVLAIESLAEVGQTAVRFLPSLMSATQDENSRVRVTALAALERLSPHLEKILPSFLLCSYDTDPVVRSVAVRSLGRIAAEHPTSITAFIRALDDLDEGVRFAAASTLGALRLPPRTLAPVLIEHLLSDRSRFVRIEIAHALARIGPASAEVIPALQTALSDKDPDVRRQAVIALGEIGPAARGSAPMLRRALQDLDPDVRAAAKHALPALAKGSSKSEHEP